MKDPNRLVFDGSKKQFYEVYYLIFADPQAGRGTWLRYTLLNPGDAHRASGPALWAGFCDRGDPARNLTIDRGFPGEPVTPGDGGAGLVIGEAALSGRRATGALERDGRSIAWDVTWEGQKALDTGMHPKLAAMIEPRMGTRIPYPLADFSGTVTVDGTAIEVEGLRGHQAHHWGQRKVKAWAWGHACDFEDDRQGMVSVLHPSLAGARIAGPIFLHLRLAGRDWTLWAPQREAEGRYTPGRWSFVASTGNCKAEVRFTAEPDTMLDFLYHSPAYATSRCFNSTLCRVEAVLQERRHRFSGWREAASLQGWGTAEVVRPE